MERVAAVIAACALAFAASPAAPASHPRGWTPLQPPPFFTSSGVAVWTGNELFHWSGETPAGGYAHVGAVYDPAARRWHPVRPGPLRPRSWAGAVWTGSEVVVWGGSVRDHPARGGAAFDPATQRWHVLPRAPLSPRPPVATVWTGREMIVWGDLRRHRAARDGAAYDPRRNRWRRLRAAPIALNDATGVWTGRELVVIGALLDVGNRSRTRFARGIAYDPHRDTWRVVPQHPLSPQASYAVWTGEAVLAWDYELRAAAYEPASNSWQPRPRLPLSFSECSPRGARSGRHVLASHCGGAAVFDTRARRWTRIATPRSAVAGRPVAAGDRFLVVGAGRLWAYRPPR